MTVRATEYDRISWLDRTWRVKSGWGAPGSTPATMNYWHPGNVAEDSNGALHLNIAKAGGVWSSAEIWTVVPLGFGTHEFWVECRMDRHDENVVLGLFSYAGPDGCNEIDVEYSRWGRASRPVGGFTVYPPDRNRRRVRQGFGVRLHGTHTTTRYVWRQTSIHFEMLHGFQEGNKNLQESWTFAPRDYLDEIPQIAMPLHLNLWICSGPAGYAGGDVEVVLHRVSVVP